VFSGKKSTSSWRTGVIWALAALAALALACAESPTEPPQPPLPPDPTLTFNIKFRYVIGTNPTAGQRQAIDEAVTIWDVSVGRLWEHN
jgi:predicted cobalt transporter CbtA